MRLRLTLKKIVPKAKPQPASKEIFTFLGFVVLATFIWLAHAWYAQDPQTVHSTPASFEKEPEDIVIDKSFTLPIEIKNVPRGQHLIIFPQEATVVVSVSNKYYASVREDAIQAYVTYPANKTDKLEVKVRHQNKHILTWRVSPTHVEYLIEQQ